MPNKWRQNHNFFINEQRDRYTSIYEQEPKRHSFHLDERHFPLSLSLYEVFVNLVSGIYYQIFQDIFLVSLKRIGLQQVETGNSEGQLSQATCAGGYAYNYEELYRLGKEFYIINDDDNSYFEELTQEDIDQYISEAAGLKIEKFQTVEEVDFKLQPMAQILSLYEPEDYLEKTMTYKIAHKPQYDESGEEISNAEVPTLSMPSISLGVWNPDGGNQPSFYTQEYLINRQYNRLKQKLSGRQTDRDYYWKDFPIVPTEIRSDICNFTELMDDAETREDDRNGQKPPLSITDLSGYNADLSIIFEKFESQLENEKETYIDMLIKSYQGGRRINKAKLEELLHKVETYLPPLSFKTESIKLPRMIQRSEAEIEELKEEGREDSFHIDDPNWGLAFAFRIKAKQDEANLVSSPKKYDPFDIYIQEE